MTATSFSFTCTGCGHDVTAGHKCDGREGNTVQKPRYDLLPPEALEILATVYAHGAAKYADRNWEAGMDWGRVFGAAQRHAWAFWRGEDLDPDSKLPHLAHAIWNLIALYVYSVRGIGKDDSGWSRE